MIPHRDSRRCGSLLVCVLVCLGIAMSIMLTAVHSSLRARRQITRELQMEQTRWLVDAGLARGLAKINSEPGYSGERWDVAPVLDSHLLANIEITVDTEGLAEGKTRLSVTASLIGQDRVSQPTRRSSMRVVDRIATKP